MTERVGRGEVIDSRKIRKHLEDVLALSGLLQPGQVIEIPERARVDMRRFVQLANDVVGPGQILMLQRIAAAYALG